MGFSGFAGGPGESRFVEPTTLPRRRRAGSLAGIAFTGAFIAAMMGHPQGALAACQGENTASVTCDAANQATAGTLSTSFAGATVVNVNAGSKIDTGGATASANGNLLTFNHNDTTFGITNTGVSAGVSLSNVGAITYLGNANVNALGSNGVTAFRTGAGDITITNNATVTAAGAGIVANASGGPAGTILVNGSGDVAGGTWGIYAVHTGLGLLPGGITISGSGNTSATGGVGIDAQVTNANNTGSVLVNRTGTVTVTEIGILAQTFGGGDVSVTGVGNVSSSGNAGIVAASTGGNGNVLVTPAGTVSGTEGIRASAAGSGTSTVNIAHDVTATHALGNAVVSVTSDGLNTVNVTAGTVQGGQSAISAISSGTGAIKVMIGAGAVVQGGTADGVSIFALGGGTANTVENSGTITSHLGLITIGIGGSTAITNSGSITGTSGTAVILGGANNSFVMTGAAAALTGAAIGSGTDTFRLAGSAANSFNVSQIGSGWTLLDKVDTSIWTLTGTSTYAGPVTVNGGTLSVDGNLVSANSLSVNANAALTGTGAVGATQINAGGIFAPGNGTAGSSMTVASLALASGAQYMVQIDPATSSFANVTGTATLGGATVNATFANGTYVDKQYTILTAGTVSGTFDPTTVNTNLPSGFQTSLAYDGTHAYLDLALVFVPPPGTGLNINQQNVGNAIINFFNSNGSIPIVFGGLTPAGLTQISGEIGTAPQQTTFDAMNLFIGVLTDPFIAGRGDPISAGGNPNAFADEAMAYASSGKGRTKRERDAYAAVYTKAPPLAPTFEQRWSIWGAGFGGSQRTDGNTVVGSNDTRSSIYGVAAGADYRFSPNTIAGFALAGGGTNFSVNGLGTGRSDLFQAGGFIRHNIGPAYITGALAYGWQDITTDRTVTVAGIDRLRAQFNANAWSGRIEGGYRFVAQGFGWTPYAAGQFTTFDLPAYAEQVISGANTFALAYAAKSVTATRSELGVRTDKSFAVQNGIFTLRGRAAWAHNFNTDRNALPTFQALPGASFVVNGAAQAPDAALVTGSAEMKWINGWSVAATFEGEFSDVTESYAGKGVVRYAW
jgi:uncharacterized protein with beta-barrel porin domain